jgi:Ammonium Transporter Family
MVYVSLLFLLLFFFDLVRRKSRVHDVLTSIYLLSAILFFFVLVYEWGRGSGDFTLIGIQLIGVLFIFGWVFTVMGTFFYFMNWMGWLRIDPLEEAVGMDISRHKGAAYDIMTPDKELVEQLRISRHDNSNRGKKVVEPDEPEKVAAEEAMSEA